MFRQKWGEIMNKPFELRRDEAAVSELAGKFSIEILPSDATKFADFRDHLPAGTRVYVAFTSGGTDNIVQAAEKLARQGMVPVPHIPARRIAGEALLADYVGALAAAGADEVLLIGGDCREPEGPFGASIDILRTGILEAHGIKRFGVAGHPEGHPVVGADQLRTALIEKRDYAQAHGLAMHVTTQFLFAVGPLVDWHRDVMRGAIPDIPVDVGMPGLAKTTTLLRFAKDCGVGTSMSMLTKNAARAFKLATAYAPDEALVALAGARQNGNLSQVRSIHLYPFGSFERTAAWARALAAGRFRVNERDSTIDTW
jgi:methylenetetrahydrofolate reductase (NADPH)